MLSFGTYRSGLPPCYRAQPSAAAQLLSLWQAVGPLHSLALFTSNTAAALVLGLDEESPCFLVVSKV